jgi:hypothetical protein
MLSISRSLPGHNLHLLGGVYGALHYVYALSTDTIRADTGYSGL